MQKIQTGTKGNVGALRADAIKTIGNRAEAKASSHMLALAARRILSERSLRAQLEPCTQRVGADTFSVLEMLKNKAEGASPSDAATLALEQAVSMLLSNALIRISLRAYSRGSNGYRTSAADILEGHAGHKGWELCIGHI